MIKKYEKNIFFAFNYIFINKITKKFLTIQNRIWKKKIKIL